MMKKDKLSISVCVREINNGFIVTSSVGLQFGKHEQSGETYCPTLEAAAAQAGIVITTASPPLEEGAKPPSKHKG